MLKWLRGWRRKPGQVLNEQEPLELVEGQTESHSVRVLRMVEPIRLETTPEQHMDLLKAVGVTGHSKAEIIRAALTMALPSLISNPSMIDILQPGSRPDHDGLNEANGRLCYPDKNSPNGRG